MNILVDSYYYLFFRLCKWYSIYFGESDLPHLSAALILGVLAMINWITLQMATKLLLGLQALSWSTTAGILSVLVIGIFLYLVFFRERRFENIMARFQDKGSETKHNLTTLAFISWAYPVITFLLFIIVSYFSWGINVR